MTQPFSRVHQILPSLHVADASGAHTLHARDALERAGFVSEMFVDQVDPPLRPEVKMFDELDDFVVPGSTALLYQLAVGSGSVERLLTREEPLLVNYHNLTPASFFGSGLRIGWTRWRSDGRSYTDWRSARVMQSRYPSSTRRPSRRGFRVHVGGAAVRRRRRR